ncbi:MAG: hypothetical protein AAFQ95_05925 [Cyanobacteria bacterium J06621_3]
MTKHILLLVLIGLALAVFHIPSVIVPVAAIATLSFFTIKLFWRMMQSFSSSAQPSQTTVSAPSA